MSFATVDGWPVVELSLTMPLLGAWHAEATVDADELPSGLVLLEAPGLYLAGSVTSSTDYGGRVRLRIEAGAGVLASRVPPRFFRGATHRQIVAETLREVGETLAAASLLGGASVAWCRAEGSAGATVAAVARLLDLAWGANDAGEVVLFAPGWEPLEIEDATEVAQDGIAGRFILGATDLSARPGRTIEERRITCVRHVIDDAIRTELTTEPS
jgi:hypothetical protein